MSDFADSTQVINEFRNLLAKSLQGNMQLFNRFTALAGDAAARFSSSAARSGTLPSLGETFGSLAQLNLSYWSTLNDHAFAFANDLASATERAFDLKPRSDSKTRNTKLEINLVAHPGERAVAAFQVENSLAQTFDVAFQAGDLVDASGARLKTKSIVFNPAALTLLPKTHAVVQVALDVPDKCENGKSYSLPIELIGFPMKTMTLRLHIVAPPTAQGAAAKKTATAKKAKRKASR